MDSDDDSGSDMLIRFPQRAILERVRLVRQMKLLADSEFAIFSRKYVHHCIKLQDRGSPAARTAQRRALYRKVPL